MAKRIKKLKFKNNLFSLKKLLISFTVFLLLFITFGIGLKSGAERDELYKITKYFKDKIFTSKNKVSDLEISKKFENKIEYKKNQYDQLTFYHDKIQIERPLIDKKTLSTFKGNPFKVVIFLLTFIFILFPNIYWNINN